MIIFIWLFLLTVLYALAALVVEAPAGGVGRYIGSALALWLVLSFGVGQLLGPAASEDLGWFLSLLLTVAVTWLFTWPWARFIYDVDSRQAAIMATTCAVGVVLIGLFLRWAMS